MNGQERLKLLTVKDVGKEKAEGGRRLDFGTSFEKLN